MYWFAQLKHNLDAKDYANYTSTGSSYNNVSSGLENIILFMDNPEINNIVTSAYERLVSTYDVTIDIKDVNMSWFNKTELASIQMILNNLMIVD